MTLQSAEKIEKVDFMALLTWLLIITVAWLAFSNGANDNFKGVATLFGSGATSYRLAIWWAMITTFMGAAFAFYLGSLLIKAFSGKGLVGAEVLADPAFLFAVASAAALTVFLATRLGFPISTTHAIIGGLIGAGLIAPGGVAFLLLGKKLLLPLLIAPLLGIAMTYLLYHFFHFIRLKLNIKYTTCLCVGTREYVVATERVGLRITEMKQGAITLNTPHGASINIPNIDFSIDDEAKCIQRYEGRVLGINVETVLNILHFISAGAVGFARGLQDTAKIVGILVGASLVGLSNETSLFWGIGLVAISMACGGMLNARKIAETLGHKITTMNHGQGFTANLVTSFLVIGSAIGGWGVSTTHCSVGALFGIGLANAQAQWKMIKQIVLAWLITLPVSLALALLVYSLVRAAH